MMHIAIIGCGQLSRMLALAGIPLGFRFSFVADSPGLDTRCVQQLGSVVHWHDDQSPGALYNALGQPDVITAEKEQIDVKLLHSLSELCAVHPNPSAFAALCDRAQEKQLLVDLGVPSASHVSKASAAEANEQLALPLVAKSCRGGYDGKNQWVLRTLQDVARFDANPPEQDYIIEQWIPFDKEVSIISARDLAGNVAHYPVTENVHENGILKRSIAPARGIPQQTTQAMQDHIARVMDATEYVGVMAMECFVVGDQVLVNEIAPRVHNSGHWTQSGCKTSQFENHLRAITGLALGSTEHHTVSGMVNLIGNPVPTHTAFSNDSTLHWYNKAVRPGRKLGHVNFSGADHDELLLKMNQFQREAIESQAEAEFEQVAES